MSNKTKLPKTEDLVSVGTRVSWSAIVAGTVLALGVYFLLGSLGTAVGLSAVDRANPNTLHVGAVMWAFLTTVTALFVGGLVASLLTVGENHTEAVLSGVSVWAFLVVTLLVLGGLGVRAGFSAMNEAVTASAPNDNWEVAAKKEGATDEQIETWRKQIVAKDRPVMSEADKEEAKAIAKKVAWYTFAGTWLSMLAAAAGAYVGAGPVFRIVVVPTTVTV
jgi:hypothetical protein